MFRSKSFLKTSSGAISLKAPKRYASSSLQARVERIIKRSPRFMGPYLSNLKSAPFSYVASFLILHEVTAVLPLFGLTAGFYYTGWSPQAYIDKKQFNEGLEKFFTYFSKKQWFGFGQIKGDTPDSRDKPELEPSSKVINKGSIDTRNLWIASVDKENLLIQVATAYTITKVLLPVRIAITVWSTPWFARAVLGKLRGSLLKK